MDTKHGGFEEDGGRDQQIDRAERRRQPDRDDRTEQGSSGAAGGNEPEQSLALLGSKQIGHERPEHRHREQVEHADPDKKYPCDDHLFYVENQQHPEQNQVGDEEMVDDGNKPDPRQSRHQRTVERLRDEQAEKRGREQPRQVFHATGHAHLVAQRTQHIVAGKQREATSEGPQRGRTVLRRSRHRALQPAHEKSHGASDSFCLSSAALTFWPYPGAPRWKRRASPSLPTSTGSKPASRTSPAATCTAS